MPPSITDVPGVLVGHATDEAGGTGCTVILSPEGGMPCTVNVRGRATGSRELDTCRPESLAGRVDAIVLTGGSAFGLRAADGVMRWLEERGRGFAVGPGVVPIVPAAVVFDLFPCGRFDSRPTPEMGTAACEAAGAGCEEGSVGAGTGATVGKGLGPTRAMKGGVGSFSLRAGEVIVGAIAVVNALGDVTDGKGGVIAGARSRDGSFAGLEAYLDIAAPRGPSFHQTTLVVVATNASLSRTELGGVARAAADGLARRIVPVGTAYDGDIVFACSAGSVEATPLRVEQMARESTEAAIERAVRSAKGRDGIPGLADA